MTKSKRFERLGDRATGQEAVCLYKISLCELRGNKMELLNSIIRLEEKIKVCEKMC